jgi:hypothetical protein
MNGDRDWFFKQPRSRRKEILTALHAARRLLIQSGSLDDWRTLEGLVENLEDVHDFSKSVGSYREVNRSCS